MKKREQREEEYAKTEEASPNREGQPPMTRMKKEKEQEKRRGKWGVSRIIKDKCEKRKREGKNRNGVLTPLSSQTPVLMFIRPNAETKQNLVQEDNLMAWC